MLDWLIPRTVDNRYRGYKAALWIFGVLLLLRLVMSINSMVNAAFVASSADGIPLDTYPPDAAGTIVALFALLGFGRLVICLICLLALIRYRSLISFLFVLLLLDHVGRKLILHFLPIIRSGTPPASVINLILLALMITGLAFSFPKRSQTHPS